MFDVFVFLFEYFQNLGHLPSKHYITEKLDEAGFEYVEIVNALKCFDDLFNEDNLFDQEEYPEISTNKMRVFSPEEVSAIPTEIRGYLHFLYQEKVMSYYGIEMLIHAIMKFESDDIDLETVKVMTLITAWVHQSEIPILIGDDLLNALYEKNVIH